MLARTNPKDMWAFGPFRSLSDDLERFVHEFRNDEGALRCTLDVREDAGHFFVDADVPGFSKDDIDITLEDNVLTIRGETSAEKDTREGEFHVRERRAGTFARRVQLPSTVDQGKVKASLKDGVLTVTLDKKEEVKPRKIEVKVN